jgi:hypothetical protein
MCRATSAGAKLLDTIDPLVDAADEEAVSVLNARDLAQFVDLLDTVRGANAKRGAPRTMVRANPS